MDAGPFSSESRVQAAWQAGGGAGAAGVLQCSGALRPCPAAFPGPRRLLAALSPCRCSHSAGCPHPSSPAQVAAPGAVRLLMSRSSEARAPEQSSSKQDPTVTEKTADLQNAALPPPKKAPLIHLFSCCLYMVTADESRQVQP